MEYNEYLLLREDVLKWVQKRLKDSRYRHTLGVEQLSVSLSRRFGSDPALASIAALLHDNAKNLSLEKQLKLYKEEVSLLAGRCHQRDLLPYDRSSGHVQAREDRIFRRLCRA